VPNLFMIALVMAAAGALAEDCIQVKDPSQNTAIAKELIEPATRTVYIAGGASALDDGRWSDYSPPAGLRKNTTRHLLFDGSCFLRSFTRPPACEGHDCLSVRRIDGHTWIELARAAEQRCIPDPAGCTPVHGKPGNLRAVALTKCQHLTFRERIFELEDPTGNRFVMHATGDGQPSLDVELPPGWRLSERALPEALVVRPESPDSCQFTLVRDARDQSYHQYDFSGVPLFDASR